MRSSNADYIKAYQQDAEKVNEYYLKHLQNKSGQQVFLEKIISENKPVMHHEIADVACGAGTLSYHISKLYPEANFTLIDVNDSALDLAKEILKETKSVKLVNHSIFELDTFKEQFDIVFCWMTLLALDKPKEALEQLVSACKKGGKIYLSSLFNFHHDVDIYSHFKDLTRDSGKDGVFMQYNTISLPTVAEWLKGKVQSYKVHEFMPETDFLHDGKGIGTATTMTADGKRLQISGGMLMNWGILEITK
jgi:ubiquinone/menaquinone biosynthesis C-methylase UbiE